MTTPAPSSPWPPTTADPLGRSLVNWHPFPEAIEVEEHEECKASEPQVFVGDGSALQRVRVRKISATFNLGIPLDLQQLANQAPNAELCGKHLELKGLRPRWAANLSQNGLVKLKMRSADTAEARLASKKLARMVRRVHCAAATFKHWQVQNLEVIANLPFRLDLIAAADMLSEHPVHFFVFSQSRGSLMVEVKDFDMRVCVRSTGSMEVFKSKELSVAGLTVATSGLAIDMEHFVGPSCSCRSFLFGGRGSKDCFGNN